jgi:hypothetical protein
VAVERGDCDMKKGSHCDKKKRERATVGATVPDQKKSGCREGRQRQEKRSNCDMKKGSYCDKKKREQVTVGTTVLRTNKKEWL